MGEGCFGLSTRRLGTCFGSDRIAVSENITETLCNSMFPEEGSHGRCFAVQSPAPVTSNIRHDFRTVSDDDDRAGLDAAVHPTARKVDTDE